MTTTKIKIAMKLKTLPLFILLALSLSSYAQNGTATYSVVFTSNWTPEAHPDGPIPSGAHWSKLVGATHNSEVTFFEMGEIASPGVEDVAELGNNDLFYNEVNTAIGNNTALELIDGPGLATGTGEITIEAFTASTDHPLVSLISMIAPSPDWVIAINSLSLTDENGIWKPEIIIDLYPYDAGTDSGINYTSADEDTNPKEPMSSLQGVFPFSSEKIGTFTITLEDLILSTPTNTIQESVTIFPNPFKDRIDISNNASNFDIENVSLYNTLGKQLLTVNAKGGDLILNTESLSNGLYILHITNTNGEASTHKIVKR